MQVHVYKEKKYILNILQAKFIWDVWKIQHKHLMLLKPFISPLEIQCNLFIVHVNMKMKISVFMHQHYCFSIAKPQVDQFS